MARGFHGQGVPWPGSSEAKGFRGQRVPGPGGSVARGFRDQTVARLPDCDRSVLHW